MNVLKGVFLNTLYLYVCNCFEITDVCNECTGCLAEKSKNKKEERSCTLCANVNTKDRILYQM